MRIKKTPVYTYDELNDTAKEKARQWFLRYYPDHEWWDSIYDDTETIAKYLGIDFNKKTVPLMSGKTRYDPEIYFQGFYTQGSGSSFAGRWNPKDIDLEQLAQHAPIDEELARIGHELQRASQFDPEMFAAITCKRDTYILVDVTPGKAKEDELLGLEGTRAHTALQDAMTQQAENVREALRDFNVWIFNQLQTQYEYLTSMEHAEESIRANEYEFTKAGEPA